jgi:hypothetical protein
MTDEPAGLDIDAEHASKLVRAKALLRGAHDVDRLQPDVQRHVARFEDGPDLDSKGFAAGVALVNPDTGTFAF